MSKQKMLAAKELIQEKRYDEARAILRTVDHPKAKEWLNKLNQIAPEFVEPSWDNVQAESLPDIDENQPATQEPKTRSRGGVGCFVPLRCGCYLTLFIILSAWLAFGVAVSFVVRDVVQDLGDSVTSGELSATVETSLSDAGVEGVTDDIARQVITLIDEYTEVTISPETPIEVSEDAPNVSFAIAFLSFLCPVLPLLLYVLFGGFRSLLALRG